MSEDGSEKPIIQQLGQNSLGRRTFLRRAGIAAAGVGATLLGLNRFNQTQEPQPSNIPENPKPEATPSQALPPEQQNPSEEKIINQVEFLYESKDALTQEEFFKQFDLMYKEGQKSPDKYWKPEVVYHTPTGEVVFLGKRTRSYPKTKSGDPTPTSEINMLQIAVKKGNYFETPNYTNRKLNQYPGESETLQYFYELYEGHESEKSTHYLEWSQDLSPTQKTINQGEMSPEELYKLSKTLTDGFNWAVQNDGFYKEPKQAQPRITFPQETVV